jgi:tetratricopeptide (TPR) repeat protein
MSLLITKARKHEDLKRCFNKMLSSWLRVFVVSRRIESAVSPLKVATVNRVCAACVVFGMVAGACTRSTSSSEVREQAYRSNNRGIALLEQFNYPEAAEAFRQALQIDSSIANAHVNLGLALLYAQDLQGAAREAAEAARLLPSAPQPPYILGLIARAENRTADALREFERVKQVDAADVGTNVNLGQIYLEERRYPEAIAALRTAYDAEPYNVTAAYNLGLALTRSGQTAEGQAMLQRAQALRTIGYSVTYGTGYLEQGRYAEAIASTGAEPELVDTAIPPVAFTPEPIGSSGGSVVTTGSPFGRRYTAADLTLAGGQAIAAGLGGCVTLLDIDSDGSLDLFEASILGQRLFRNDGRGGWTDVTAAADLGNAPSTAVPIGCVGADYDNDARVDLFVLRYGMSTLYHNEGNGRFADRTGTAAIGQYPFLPGAAAFVDVDHDGDLDLVIAGLADLVATRQRAGSASMVFPRDFSPAPLRLLRNNGNGTFADVTASARLQIATHAVAIVPTDFDNRRDVDLMVVNRGTPPLHLFQNVRDGTFRDVAASVGLLGVAGSDADIAAVAAADVNKDDFPDFFFGRDASGVFAMSDGRGRFTSTPLSDPINAAFGASLVDYDNDGLFDLLTWSNDGPKLARNVGRGWTDVSSPAFRQYSVRGAQPVSARSVGVADVNGDGTPDLIAAGSGSVSFWRTSGGAGRSQRVDLRGRVGNRQGIGSKIQLRAGSLSARIESSAATPAIAAADVIFGLGARPGADAVRILWPSGILQAETPPAPTAPGQPAPPGPLARLVVEELDRKPSSCPFLFTWNGERFEFVSDFMGAGEMGYWEAPNRRNRPDPVEYVRIRADQLRPREGIFELRATNELEEVLFADRLELLAVSHPRGIDVYPNEGMAEPPKPFALLAVSDERIPRAVDDHGHDVTDRIAQIDWRYPDDFALDRIRGYAAPHALTLDLTPSSWGPASAGPKPDIDRPVLLLTAWTDYAFSSDNLAASHAGLALSPPSLQIKDVHGRWRTAVADIGIPVGRPQTIPIELGGLLRRGEREVRIVSNMRIYWDRIAVGRADSLERVETRRVSLRTAVLRERGFSQEVKPSGAGPLIYDYQRVFAKSPWKSMPGRYTRLGDVRDLLAASDDMFVIAKPGDEVALQFDAQSLPPLPDGWTRTFLLVADGYSKEMDINSASPDDVEPLPFHAMTSYPYPASERYPETPEHQRYRETYNTRIVIRTVPSLYP